MSTVLLTPTAATETASDLVGGDVTACDREPIHLCGAIQPHGLLLVADAGLKIVGAAGDVEGRLADRWLDRPLAELIGVEAAIATGRAAPDAPVHLGRVRGEGGEDFDGVASVSGVFHLVQFEPVGEAASDGADVLSWLDRAGGAFERAASLGELCARAAEVFRSLTGYDRVMIYRFLDDDAGVVLAEDRAEGMASFLNHHFPASDIPRQARALYIRNRVRVIPDVGYLPSPLRPEGAGLEDLDLGEVGVRSVSPVHIQYLKNMGVAASASISIVKDGVLWGLVACHNMTPKTLTHVQQMTCRALAGGLARQVRAKEEAEDYRERLRLRAAEDTVLARLAAEPSMEDLFTHAAEELRRMLGADGFAALQGRQMTVEGRCPDLEDLRELFAFARQAAAVQPFSTHCLGERLPTARAYADLASGLLAVVLSADEPVALLWLRAEKLQVVEWAGNPHKAVALAPGETLTPRTSFEAWSEEVRGRAQPWTLGEIEAAQRLTRNLFEARQTRRIRELNKDLAESVSDKEALLQQKDYLIKEVNHRIQNSLQLVGAFLSMQGRAADDEAVSGHLSEAQRRLSAVALVHRRLYSDDNVELVDLARYLEELCVDLRDSMGAEWAEHLSVDFAPILISADRAVNVGLVLTELMINATKYAYGGKAGPVSISLQQHRNRFRLIVADRGVGKTGARHGFGSRMLDAMVQSLGGDMEEGFNAPGLRVIVSAPVS